jgi:hypothetical protein
MQDPVVPSEDRIDVGELMGRIRRRIEARKLAAASGSAAEVESLAASNLQTLAEEAGIEAELLARLMAGGGWNTTIDYRIQSHRVGLARTFVVSLKRLIRPFVRLYTDPVLHRQSQINLYTVHLCRALVRELTRLEVEQAALRQRCERLERALDARPPGPAG